MVLTDTLTHLLSYQFADGNGKRSTDFSVKFTNCQCLKSTDFISCR